MPTSAFLHAPTLLVAISLTNVILAAAVWMRYVKTSRAGLRGWSVGLMLETLAAALLLSAARFGDIALVFAAAALALGVASRIRALAALHQQDAPAWLLVSGPALAIAAFATPALSMQAAPAQSGSGAFLLVLYGVTTAASVAFLVAARNSDSMFRR
jgi:hypothetical protein